MQTHASLSLSLSLFSSATFSSARSGGVLQQGQNTRRAAKRKRVCTPEEYTKKEEEKMTRSKK
jgi:hypothetical protein